jgi:ubiquinone/menaquinone biosynthesis C-methylase UbiE
VPGYRGHRTFAAFWDWAVRHESKRERELRRGAAGSVSGRVLELGVGVGANWQYLPPGIAYTGIDPDPYMLERARKHAAERDEPRDLRQAPAEDLPFPDASFDTVLVTLTLCSVEDPVRALAEARRVLKPGGRLVFVEHVRPDGRVRGHLADWITPAWRRVGAGCHPNRRTADSIVAAGFEVEQMARQRVNGIPMIAGTARKPV